MKGRSFVAAFVSVLVVAGLLLSGCNTLFSVKQAGPVATRDFDFTDFDAVDVGSAFTVDISPASTYSVRITAPENMFDDVRVVKTGKVLKIGLDWKGMFLGARKLEASITMPDLAELRLSGAAKGTVKGFRSGRALSTRISGASRLDLDVETGALTAEISGASEVTGRIKSTGTDIELSGASSLTLDLETGAFVYRSSGASDAAGSVRASSSTIELTGASGLKLTGSGGDLKLNNSGASDARLAGFSVGNADIYLSGASEGEVDPAGRLDASLSGASRLRYGGNPTMGARMDITGGSRLEHR